MNCVSVRYHGPTDTKGSRLCVSSKIVPGRLTVGYDYSLNLQQNVHVAAVRFLAAKNYPAMIVGYPIELKGRGIQWAVKVSDDCSKSEIVHCPVV